MGKRESTLYLKDAATLRAMIRHGYANRYGSYEYAKKCIRAALADARKARIRVLP